jgi:transglutaminase-like putative cysteine protease
METAMARVVAPVTMERTTRLVGGEPRPDRNSTVEARMLPRLFLIAAMCLPSAREDDPWPVKRGPSREPEPYRYEPRILNEVPKEFLEDSAACILYFGTTNLVDADGTTETICHDLTRLNSRKGVEKLGEYRSVFFDPSYQTLTLHVARVHKADGKIVQVRPRHLKLRDQGTDYQVYDAEKQLIISFPNLEVGDVIEVKWSTRGKCPEFLDHFFTRYTFGDIQYPLVRDEFRVRLPRDKALKFATINGEVETLLRTDRKYRHYLWRALNLPPVPSDDNLPSKEELRLQMSCSTFTSWEEVGRWKKQVRADCWRCTPEIRRVIDEVTKGLATDLEKARALTYWVRRHIRYLSMPSAKHSYTPHDPKEVLANLYGDCKDQAQLLAVMLREIGIPVALVTLGAQDDGQVLPEVPSPWGTHAILLVTIAGRQHWIDTTSTFATWNFLPPDDRDRVAYVTDDDGLRILRTPPLSCEDNRFEQTTWLTIDVDGASTARRLLTYHGAAALSQRDTWTDVAAGERRRLMSATLQDAHSQSRLSRLQVDERKLLDLDQPVEGAVEFSIPNHFCGEADLEGSVADSRVWNRIVGYPLDPDRSVAMDLGRPFESIHRYVVQLPPAYRLDALPRFRRITSRWGSFTLRAQFDADDPHRLTVTFHTRLEKTRIDPVDFAAFRTFHEQLSKHWRAWLTLKPTRAAEDALLLNLELLSRPDDKFTALVLARLYPPGTPRRSRQDPAPREPLSARRRGDVEVGRGMCGQLRSGRGGLPRAVAVLSPRHQLRPVAGRGTGETRRSRRGPRAARTAHARAVASRPQRRPVPPGPKRRRARPVAAGVATLARSPPGRGREYQHARSMAINRRPERKARPDGGGHRRFPPRGEAERRIPSPALGLDPFAAARQEKLRGARTPTPLHVVGG